MPTESQELNIGKVLYKGRDETIKELANYEFKEENNDDAIDADNPQTAAIAAMLNRDLELKKLKVKKYFEMKVENENDN